MSDAPREGGDEQRTERGGDREVEAERRANVVPSLVPPVVGPSRVSLRSPLLNLQPKEPKGP